MSPALISPKLAADLGQLGQALLSRRIKGSDTFHMGTCSCRVPRSLYARMDNSGLFIYCQAAQTALQEDGQIPHVWTHCRSKGLDKELRPYSKDLFTKAIQDLSPNTSSQLDLTSAVPSAKTLRLGFSSCHVNVQLALCALVLVVGLTVAFGLHNLQSRQLDNSAEPTLVPARPVYVPSVHAGTDRLRDSLSELLRATTYKPYEVPCAHETTKS